jgi:putative ABC transport system substrate-binding protein
MWYVPTRYRGLTLGGKVKRREFITLLGGAAAAWPLAARAQQPATPVIGYLYGGTPEGGAIQAAGFRKGLADAGFVEGRNVRIEYRWGDGDNARLPEFAADLVRGRVAVIAALALGAALAAKDATRTVPIVFGTGTDPVQLGLVESLNRPGGNITGFSNFLTQLGAKQVGLLHELLPRATRFGVLLNTSIGASAESFTNDVQRAAATIGRQIEIFPGRTSREIDAAFIGAVQKSVDAVLITVNPLYVDRRVQIVTSATHHRLPAIYSERENVEIGGLMSYGTSNADRARQVGLYVARILKGEKPGDLPVQQATKFELLINAHTAKLLGIEVPPTLLATADEVIE